MKNNNPPFYVGQSVVALKTSGPNDLGQRFVKGDTYTVAHVFKCYCGVWRICCEEVRAELQPGAVWHCIPATLPYNSAPASNFAPIRETRTHKRIAVPEELLVVKEGDVLEPEHVKI